MRIMSREAFLAMPAETVFSYYRPCVFSDLLIKGETANGDFWTVDIIGAIEFDNTGDFMNKCNQMEDGSSVPLDLEIESREALFDPEQLFAVYEKQDLERLIERLARGIK